MGVAIILLILIMLIILIYVIYYMLASAQTLSDLNTQQPEIVFDKIVNPNSIRYTYSMWLYVNVWPSGQTAIFSAQTASDAIKYTRLYLTAGIPELKCDIYVTGTPSTSGGATSIGPSTTKTVSITTNFPMQRWVYIVISMDGTVIDCYLDGKLVRSMDLGTATDVAKVGTGVDEYTITFGKFDAFMTSFKRIDGATDPQTAWTQYLAGNGHESKINSSYGFKFSVNRDKDIIASYQY